MKVESNTQPGAGPALRIGVDARSLLRAPPRGEGQTLLRLYEAMANLHQDVEIVLFTDRVKADSRALVANAQRFKVAAIDPPGHRFSVWRNVALPWLCARYRVDVLHAFSSMGPRWSPVPVVLTVHDVIPALFGPPDAAERTEFVKGLEDGVRRARIVTCPSQNTASDLQRFLSHRPLPQAVVVPWAPTVAEPTRARLLQRRSAKPSSGKQPFLLAFGGSDPRKNTVRLIEAFAGSTARQSGFSLVLLGVDPVSTERFNQYAAKLGCADAVSIERFVPDSRRDELLGDAFALIYPSLYEGFGLPVLDAMSIGLPVIASHNSSIPEVGGDGVEYFDAQSAESLTAAIDRVVTRPEVAGDLSGRGARRAEQFTWARSANSYLAILREAARQATPQ